MRWDINLWGTSIHFTGSKVCNVLNIENKPVIRKQSLSIASLTWFRGRNKRVTHVINVHHRASIRHSIICFIILLNKQMFTPLCLTTTVYYCWCQKCVRPSMLNTRTRYSRCLQALMRERRPLAGEPMNLHGLPTHMWLHWWEGHHQTRAATCIGSGPSSVSVGLQSDDIIIPVRHWLMCENIPAGSKHAEYTKLDCTKCQTFTTYSWP